MEFVGKACAGRLRDLLGVLIIGQGYPTVNVDIFALLNFRASSPRRHMSRGQIFAHIPVDYICSNMIFIFTHVIFSRM